MVYFKRYHNLSKIANTVPFAIRPQTPEGIYIRGTPGKAVGGLVDQTPAKYRDCGTARKQLDLTLLPPAASKTSIHLQAIFAALEIFYLTTTHDVNTKNLHKKQRR